MALNLRGFCRLNINLASNAFFKSNVIKVGVRCLYQEKELGVIGYEQSRMMFRNQFMTIEDTFRIKMKEICEKEDGVVYTEDLKALVHLAQKNEEDMELLNKMCDKYFASKNERQFSSYVFGPVLMRMYYYLDEPKYAMTMFENPGFSNDLNYHSTIRILMTLLYKHNMFQELQKVYEKIGTEKGIDFFGNSNILLYAACLKENTQESFEYALNCWKQHSNTLRPSMRTCAIVAYLAIKNNDPETALEILSLVDSSRIMSIRNLKLMVYMKLEKWLQIIPILRYALEQDTVGIEKQTFFANVICDLEKNLQSETMEGGEELLQLIDKVKKRELLDTFNTLEENLLKPLVLVKSAMRNKHRRFANKDNFQTPKSRKSGLRSYL